MSDVRDEEMLKKSKCCCRMEVDGTIKNSFCEKPKLNNTVVFNKNVTARIKYKCARKLCRSSKKVHVIAVAKNLSVHVIFCDCFTLRGKKQYSFKADDTLKNSFCIKTKQK